MKVYKDKDYEGYMKAYNELMYMVMDINNRYKKLLGNGSCFKWELLVANYRGE